MISHTNTNNTKTMGSNTQLDYLYSIYFLLNIVTYGYG